MLLDRLEPIEDDAKFQELVEAAIIDDNNMLMEEKAALERQIQEEKRQRLQEQTERLREQEVAAHRLEQEQRQKREALEIAERERLERDATSKQLIQEQEARRVADEEKKTAEVLAAQLAKKNEFYGDAFWIGASVVLALVVFLSMQLSTIEYLVQNPERTQLQILGAALLFSIVLGISRRKWRGWLWGSLGISVLLGLVAVL